jgi:hypothetical protein
MLPIDPALPIDRMLPALPMLRMLPLLPIDRMLPKLAMLKMLAALTTLPTLRRLRKLPILRTLRVAGSLIERTQRERSRGRGWRTPTRRGRIDGRMSLMSSMTVPPAHVQMRQAQPLAEGCAECWSAARRDRVQVPPDLATYPNDPAGTPGFKHHLQARLHEGATPSGEGEVVRAWVDPLHQVCRACAAAGPLGTPV